MAKIFSQFHAVLGNVGAPWRVGAIFYGGSAPGDSLVFTHRLVAMAMIPLFSLTGWLPWQ